MGEWLPEPLLTDEADDPARQAELADSLSLAFLVLLESLTPEQRAVLVLRDVFDYGYLVVTGSASGLTFEDRGGAEVEAWEGCTSQAANRATCGVAGAGQLLIDLGPGGDRADLSSAGSKPVFTYISGGEGNDNLTGGPGADNLFGGTKDRPEEDPLGVDELHGGGLNDYLDGGGGADLLDGGGSPDGLEYEDGVDYSGRGGDISFTVDGVANDGEPGEHDNVIAVEGAAGGSGDDVLVGTSGYNGLAGGEGDDRIYGAGGRDQLVGNGGADMLDGGDGADLLRGDSYGPDPSDGSDRILGG